MNQEKNLSWKVVVEIDMKNGWDVVSPFLESAH